MRKQRGVSSEAQQDTPPKCWPCSMPCQEDDEATLAEGMGEFTKGDH
jgi:hypothetical protein